MLVVKRVEVKSYEKGLLFKSGEFKKILEPGKHWMILSSKKDELDIISLRDPWIINDKLDILAKENVLDNFAKVLDLEDKQRALVWIDGRFDRILTPGLYAICKTYRDVKVKVLDVKDAKFVDEDLNAIIKSASAAIALNIFEVEQGYEGLYFQDGEFKERLKSGRYAFWKDVGKVKLYNTDTKDSLMDISGQEIMTSDKVTLRINAIIEYKVSDALKTITVVDDARQALYRDSQLALRAMVGTKDLDNLLVDKQSLAGELLTNLQRKSKEYGLAVSNVGIKDIILPGDMKELLNKVMESRKAAEANFITRREETAAMRSQLNTAKLMESNPSLMKLKELEVLESIAEKSELKIVLGDKGLKDSVLNVI